MDIKKHKLETVKNALQYAVINAKTEMETAEFAMLLVDVQVAIIEEAESEKRVEELKSLPGCVFVYCGNRPKCVGMCVHVAR